MGRAIRIGRKIRDGKIREKGKKDVNILKE
jgi:hypothetical protein